MRAVTISSKYQVVIPREIRERFHLKAGQQIMFVPYKGMLRVVVIPPMSEALGMLKGIETDVQREERDEAR